MKKVSILAQDIMDLYLQDYADSNETFFGDIDFYVRQVCDTMSALYDEDFKALYAGLRADNLHKVNLVALDFAWLKKEKVAIKKDDETGYFKATLQHDIFGFFYDNSDVGLQDVLPVKRGGCNLIRTTQTLSWMDAHLNPSDVTFYWKGDKEIWFDRGCCKEVIVHYLPVPDGDMVVPDGKADEVKKRVLNLMLAAKSGTPVTDETNNSNANVSQQTETNNQTI